MREKPSILLNSARELAVRMHKGQVDKAGEDYFFHLSRVSAMGKTEEEKIVGLLHDLVEDTSGTLEDLREAGFPKVIVDAVDSMTKRKGEKYLDYLARVKSNPLAKVVKLNDIAGNSAPGRINKISKSDRVRLVKKYRLGTKTLLAP